MRLFVGVPVPCGEVLRPVRHTLQRLDGVRPAPEGTEHVTMRFLGDVEAEEVDAVRRAVGAAVAGARPMDAAVTRIGMFQDPRHARIVWAALEADGLQELRDRIVEATARLGQPEAERRFVPHVTLARCKHPQDLRPLLEEYPGPFWAGRVEEVVLYKSKLGPEGPEYERVEAWKLDGAV